MSMLTFDFAAPIPPPSTTKGPFARPDLEVNCLADGILVNVQPLDDEFKGVMYVKGHSSDERCRESVNFLQSGRRVVDFKVLFGVCGLFHSDVSHTGVVLIAKINFLFLRVKPTLYW